jgi:hypothetical protein
LWPFGEKLVKSGPIERLIDRFDQHPAAQARSSTPVALRPEHCSRSRASESVKTAEASPTTAIIESHGVQSTKKGAFIRSTSSGTFAKSRGDSKILGRFHGMNDRTKDH